MAIKIKTPKLLDTVQVGTMTAEIYDVDTAPPSGKPKAYRITSLENCASTDASVGEVVFALMKSDYGCADDDTAAKGFKHVSVTFKPDGDYPFFTIAAKDLKPYDPGSL